MIFKFGWVFKVLSWLEAEQVEHGGNAASFKVSDGASEDTAPRSADVNYGTPVVRGSLEKRGCKILNQDHYFASMTKAHGSAYDRVRHLQCESKSSSVPGIRSPEEQLDVLSEHHLKPMLGIQNKQWDHQYWGF
jgi:hypothetical protein